MARILIVEDEPLIGLMLAEWIEELGHTVAGPAATLTAAQALIASLPIDAAIVDFNLLETNSSPIINELEAKKVPYAVASGDSAAPRGKVALLSKPYDFETIEQTVAALLAA